MVGGVSTGLVLAAVSGITGGRIGPGDAVIFIMTGIYLGFWGNIELLMISLYMAAAVAIVMLLIMKREWDFKIPFAPFVLAAYIVILA
jgi:leader peptidase (prepilin peptidase)/N-methyltransferase